MDDIATSYEIIKIIKKTKEIMKKTMEEQFKDLNLTGPQGVLVGVLAHNGEHKISDLSEKMCLSNSTVSGIIDRLEKQGFVARKRSEEDRRIVMVDLTEEFRKESKERFKKLEEYVVNMISNATKEELNEILTGLRTLERVLSTAKNQEKREE